MMNTLQVAADSSWLIRAGAATILTLHIAGGSFAIVSGATALAFRKGSRAHALAGNVFFISIIVMGSIGGVVAPFLVDAHGNPKLFDSTAGLFTCYLAATGWMTMKRKAGTIGRFEVAAFLFAASLSAWIVLLGTRATGDATGYYGIGSIIALAAALDLKVLLKGGVSGTPRLARHLWRMSTALFVASGSFFLGQQRQMPEYMQGSPWLAVPALAPLVVMVFWLLKLRLAKPIARLKQRLRPPRLGVEV
jgi:hypothetical protein